MEATTPADVPKPAQPRWYATTPANFLFAVLVLMVPVAAFSYAWLAKERQKERERRQRYEAYEQQALAQREAIDELIREQMRQRDFKGSKLDYCRDNRPVFGFLIGKDVSLYPQLTSRGFVVTDQFLPLLQKGNAQEWMEETGSEHEYLAFKTDIWDFRSKDVPFMDTLIIAIHDGKIVACRLFADVPY
jgi:hypothetical protein